ncbi:unnamed protein product [Euphydryas editha]|uniref:Secreted protein n=1 Tax=Euphydryas editha TaxID=104508 RepID=A0AAU9TJ97_EUPED|nr:unnamed protein product [Euphydryas editha]
MALIVNGIWFVFVCSNSIQHIRDTKTTECQVDDGDSEGPDSMLGARLPFQPPKSMMLGIFIHRHQTTVKKRDRLSPNPSPI